MLLIVDMRMGSVERNPRNHLQHCRFDSVESKLMLAEPGHDMVFVCGAPNTVPAAHGQW